MNDVLTVAMDLMLLGAVIGGLWAISDGWRENRRHARRAKEIQRRSEEYRRCQTRRSKAHPQ